VGEVFSVLFAAVFFAGAFRDLDSRESRIDIALLCVIT